MLPCHEAPSRSQRNSAYSSPNRSPSPGPPLNSGPSSKSSSRHSVSFQLHSPEGAESPPPPHPRPQDVLCDGFGQLLQALAPDVLDVEPFKTGLPNPPSGSTPCARLTVPPTGPAHHPTPMWTEGEDGRTSVVTYGYIDKSNVYSRGRRSSACHSQLDGAVCRPEGALLPTQAQKRLSDPLWYTQHPCHAHPHLGQAHTPHLSPHLQRATLDTVARDATYRALEEFGSPELRRRFSGQGGVGTSSPSLPRSWGTPPTPPRSTYTLPPRVQLNRVAVNGLPRSPASDHLCGHMGYPAHAAAPPYSGPYHGQPKHWAEEGNLRIQPHLPAGRPTDIQHDLPASISPCANSRYRANAPSHNATGDVRYNAVDVPPAHISLPRHGCRTRTRSMSPSYNPDVAAKLAAEASRMSSTFAERRTPSPATSQAESLRSDSPRAGEPIQRECQPYATLHGRRSPERLPVRCSGQQNHNWSRKDPETPQTRPGRISPASSRRTSPAPASPALPAQLHRSGTSQTSPVLDPRQQQHQVPKPACRDVSSLHRYQQPQYTGDRSLSLTCERTLERPTGLTCRQQQQVVELRVTPPSSDQLSRKKQSLASQDRPQGSQGPTGNSGSRLSPHSVSQCGHVTSSSGAKVSV